jgi:exosortase H (IPTLxxWG-CTERM-specific)
VRAAKAPESPRRRSALFLVRFLGLLIAFYFLVASGPVNDAVIVPFTAGIARAGAAVLKVLGEPVTVAGTEIRSSAFAVRIENGCNGIETALLFGSAVLAFPAPWRRRLAGLLVGFLAIQLINLVRVVSLFWIGAHRPAFFSSSRQRTHQVRARVCHASKRGSASPSPSRVRPRAASRALAARTCASAVVAQTVHTS